MDMDISRLEKYYDPARFSEIGRLHENAFTWRAQERIPLGIHVVKPEYGKGLSYDRWLEPEPVLEFQIKVLADTLAVGSDVLPVVAVNHLGEAVLTSIFGARQHMPEKAGASLQEVGPTPLPIFSAIEEVDSLAKPDPEAGIVPEVKNFLRYYRNQLPGWVYVATPMPSGIFSTAMSLRGSDFLLDLIEEPERCRRLIDLCAMVGVELERDLRQITRIPEGCFVTNFGMLGAGLRLGEDSMVNISPGLIREFCRPMFGTVNRLFGGRGHIHFCSLPHSRYEHIYPALAEAPEVGVVSSQFGFEYYQEHLEELRGRLAVESFYGDAYSYVCRKYGSFRNWAVDFVPRFKNESGLALYCQVNSVDEGREIWSVWQEAHKK
jgi:hypothetical protein